MKAKILALGLFSLCATMFMAQSAQAWGLCHDWCHRYVTKITCRPYNAFTPICWGNLVCDGCVPNPCGVAGGFMPLNFGVPPWACNACTQGACVGGFCGDSGFASDMPINVTPGAPAPGTPTFQGPQPNFNPPMPMPTGPNTTMYPMMPMPVSQANYYPMPMPHYNPGYAIPMGYNPYMQPMPYYWYPTGR